jgi:formylglycine-generating enzyme required for sulfatase activity
MLGLLGLATIIVAGIGGGGWYVWIRASEQPTEAVAAATQAPAQSAPSATSPVVVPDRRAPPPPRAMSGADTPASKPEATPGPASDNSALLPTIRPPTPSAPMQAVVVPPRPPARQPDAAPATLEPEMIPIAGGTFRMGSTEDPSEQPVHSVTVQPFLIAKYPVTVRQWRACVAAKACTYFPNSDDDAPVSNVSWVDARQFADWLVRTTQQRYRLPSEAEWEYAARGGTDTRYWWGNTMKPGLVACKGCGGSQDAV